MEPFYLGAYWGSRREPLAECAVGLARFLSRLSEIDEALARWYRRGARKADAKTPVRADAESLAKLLAEGINRRDFGGEAIEHLGFAIGLWNRARPTVGLSATIGAYPAGSVVSGASRPSRY